MPTSWRERLVLRAIHDMMKENAQPRWLYGARRATKHEDHTGKDIVVTTDVGDLFIQVLTNRLPIRAWMRKHGHRNRIGVVRFGRSFLNQPKVVWPMVLDTLTGLREHELNLRQGPDTISSPSV